MSNTTELSTTFQPHYYFDVFTLASQGHTNKEIAQQLEPPVKFTAFLAWTRKDPTFKLAIEKGKQEAELKRNSPSLNETLQEQAKELTTTQMSFLMAYSKCGGLTTAGRSIGVHRSNHYQWLESSEAYQQAFETAHQLYVETFVVEGKRRAVDGVRKPKFYKGVQLKVICDPTDPEAIREEDDAGNVVYRKPYYEVTYSDKLLERFLEAYVPEFEPKGNNTNVNVGGPTFVMDSLLERVENARRSLLTDGEVIDTVQKRIEAHKGTTQ